MRRDLLLTLTLVCFAGCSAGSRSNPFISQTTPQTPTSQVATTQTAATPASNGEAASEGFSFTKMFQMVGFQKPDTPAPSLVPQEVVNLGNVINDITAQSAALNANDPPEVTRQKAQAILTSLQAWDSTLSASNSTGFVNNELAQTLNGWVGQIRARG